MSAVGLILVPDAPAGPQLRWGVALAEARSVDLVVLQRIEGKEDRVSDVDLVASEGDKPDPVSHELRGLIEGDARLRPGARPEGEESESTFVQLERVYFSSLTELRRQVQTAVSRHRLGVLTFARPGTDTTDPELLKERQLLLRHLPCEAVFVFGLRDETKLDRVFVAAATGAHGGAAVRLARDLATQSEAPLTAVRVNPPVGLDAEWVGGRRLDDILRRALGRDAADVERRVIIDEQQHRGLRRIWDEGGADIMVVGASRVGLSGSRVTGGSGARMLKGDPKPTVAIVSAAVPVTHRLLGFFEERVERLVPQITREHRVELVDRLQSSANWDFDFFALMFLSTAIAAIGLVQSSAAVVIGAMLVAPLMTPMLGLGLAVSQSNPIMARISMRAIALGVLVSLGVAFGVGLAITTFTEPTPEMLARGGPGPLDLFVAFFAGLAAAYASCRPGLLAALPGVAIAAALVPPIATSGLAFSLGELILGLQSLLLFLINMATIVLASMVSLWAVGLRNLKKDSRWTVVAGWLVTLAVVALGVFSSVRPEFLNPRLDVPADIEAHLQAVLGGDGFRVEEVEVAYDELGAQVDVRVVGPRLLPAERARRVRRATRASFNQALRVRLHSRIQP